MAQYLTLKNVVKKLTNSLKNARFVSWQQNSSRTHVIELRATSFRITERNMHPLLHQLTGGRFWDVRLTPEESNGQPGEMDYRIRIWDPAANRHVGKNIFSGGTRDQCSLALRLA